MRALLTLTVILVALGLPCWALHRGAAALPGVIAQYFADLWSCIPRPRFSLKSLMLFVALGPPIIAIIASLWFVLFAGP